MTDDLRQSLAAIVSLTESMEAQHASYMKFAELLDAWIRHGIQLREYADQAQQTLIRTLERSNEVKSNLLARIEDDSDVDSADWWKQ